MNDKLMKRTRYIKKAMIKMKKKLKKRKKHLLLMILLIMRTIYY